jgi:hypothetical protein
VRVFARKRFFGADLREFDADDRGAFRNTEAALFGDPTRDMPATSAIEFAILDARFAAFDAKHELLEVGFSFGEAK